MSTSGMVRGYVVLALRLQDDLTEDEEEAVLERMSDIWSLLPADTQADLDRRVQRGALAGDSTLYLRDLLDSEEEEP